MRVGAKSKIIRTGRLVRYGVLAVAAAVLIALSPAPASAVPVLFFGEDLNTNSSEATPLGSFPNATAAQADFLSQITNPGFEDFEDLADAVGAPLALIFPGVATATLLGSGQINVVTSGTASGRYNTTVRGDTYWDTSSSFSIDLSAPVAAFGFFGTDIGDFDGQVLVTLSLANVDRAEINIGNTVNIRGGSVLFWGIIDTGLLFDRIEFGKVQTGGASSSSTDYFGFDDMIVAAPEQISEPASLAVFGLGLAGIGFLRRRRTA